MKALYRRDYLEVKGFYLFAFGIVFSLFSLAQQMFRGHLQHKVRYGGTSHASCPHE